MNKPKREVVQIDEDKIKRMIAGDIRKSPLPVVENQEEDPKQDIVTDAENEPAETEKREPVLSQVRKKKSKFDYAKFFLEPQGKRTRRQTTVHMSEKNYSNVIKILQVSDRISISSFVNNVLSFHFEEFNDEVLEIRRNYINKLYEDD